MMSNRYLRTSDLARAVGIHANTVRLYVDWGLLPPVERSASGYRLYTQRHLDCLRLARAVYAAPYPGRGFRALGNEIIQRAVADDWSGALEKAHMHLAAVKAELERAEAAADLLEHWAQTGSAEADGVPLSLGEVSSLLSVSRDVVRNWERDGLIRGGATPSTTIVSSAPARSRGCGSFACWPELATATWRSSACSSNWMGATHAI